MHSALRLLCAASLERAAYLQGEQAQHHVFCVAAESVAWRTRGRRVEGHGTFRGAVVEGEDARSKCWVLYDDDGLCYVLGRRRYTVVDDAEVGGGPRNTRARTSGMQDVQSNVIAGAGVGNVNMLQQLPHFLMLCGAATERKRALPRCWQVKT